MAKRKKLSFEQEQRVQASQSKIRQLVDQGVEFNPQTAGETTINRAVENLTLAGGKRNLSGTSSGSMEAAKVASRSTKRAKAPRPKKRKK